MSAALREETDENGFALIRGAVACSRLEELAELLLATTRADEAARRGGARRLLDRVPGLDAWIASCLSPLVAPVIDAPFRPVRAVLFDKTPDANWKVIWHQDRVVPLRARRDADGYSSWSVKEGVLHAQPPASVLEQMIAARVHLDRCGAENGPLRVIEGSHRVGVLDAAGVDTLRRSRDAVPCHAEAGDVLLMRPLLLHASSASTSPVHRRILHVEFGAGELPGGLEWGRG